MEQHVGLFGLQVPTMVVLDEPVLQLDDVAAEGEVVGVQVIADACGLKGATSFINLILIIAQDGAVGHLRPWQIAFGNGGQATCTPFTRQHVHIRSVGILQQSLAAQTVHGVISHAVSQDNDVFHAYTLAIDMMLANTPAAVTLAPAPYP